MKKTLLITGGAKGIGLSITEYFLNKGWNVCVNYLNSEEKANELKEKYPDCMIIKADVSNGKEVSDMVKKAYDRFGFIDCVINNAGVSLNNLIQFNTEDEYNKVFDINVKGTFLTSKEVIPYMIKEKRGNIINISSIWGITGGSTEVLYSASKAAVIGFTKALAKEVGPSGINVNCIAPGVIETDMISSLSYEDKETLKEETPLNRIGTPLDIAKTAYFLASEDSSFITGQIIGVNGGILI